MFAKNNHHQHFSHPKSPAKDAKRRRSRDECRGHPPSQARRLGDVNCFLDYHREETTKKIVDKWIYTYYIYTCTVYYPIWSYYSPILFFCISECIYICIYIIYIIYIYILYIYIIYIIYIYIYYSYIKYGHSFLHV